MANDKLRVRDKAVNVSYKGILRISPDENGHDYNIEEMFSQNDENFKLIIRDSDGNDTPLAFTTSGVYIDGSLTTKDLIVEGTTTYSGDFALEGNIKADSISVGSLNVSGDVTVKGNTKLNEVLAQKASLIVSSGGKTNVYRLDLSESSTNWGYVVEFDKSNATDLKIKTTPLYDKLDALGLFDQSGGGSTPTPSVSGNSVGDIKWTFLRSNPSGWLKMDGKAYKIQDYRLLYNHLKSAFGNNHQLLFDTAEYQGGYPQLADTFRVPDIRGTFPRFASNMDSAIYGGKHETGEFQAAGVPNIKGMIYGIHRGFSDWSTKLRRTSLTGGNAFHIPKNETGNDGGGSGDNKLYDYNLYLDGSRVSRVYDNDVREIRPSNITFNAFIYSGLNESPIEAMCSIEDNVNRTLNKEGVTHEELLKAGKLAALSGRPEYRYSGCETFQDLYENGISENPSLINEYNLMSFKGGSLFGEYDKWTKSVNIFNADLPSLLTADYLFKAGTSSVATTENLCLYYFKSNMPKVTSMRGMFSICKHLNYVSINAENATNVTDMFNKCENLEYVCMNLPKLSNTTMMFKGFSLLKKVTMKMDMVENTCQMFYNCPSLSSVKIYAPLLNTFKDQCFTSCNKIENVDVYLPKFQNPYNSKYTQPILTGSGVSNLVTFRGSLKSLNNGNNGSSGSFQSAKKLENFCCDIQNLVDGKNMFYNCPSLKVVRFLKENESQNYEIDDGLKHLENGYQMFRDCSSLTSINANFPNLTEGSGMFYQCIKLRDLDNVNLGNLTIGTNMFYGCQLTDDSVSKIAETIRDLMAEGKKGTIYIGIGNNPVTQKYKDAALVLKRKGWTVQSNNNTWING